MLLRYLSGLAAELFTMRLSLLMGAAGLVLFWYGGDNFYTGGSR